MSTGTGHALALKMAGPCSGFVVFTIRRVDIELRICARRLLRHAVTSTPWAPSSWDSHIRVEKPPPRIKMSSRFFPLLNMNVTSTLSVSLPTSSGRSNVIPVKGDGKAIRWGTGDEIAGEGIVRGRGESDNPEEMCSQTGSKQIREEIHHVMKMDHLHSPSRIDVYEKFD